MVKITLLNFKSSLRHISLCLIALLFVSFSGHAENNNTEEAYAAVSKATYYRYVLVKNSGKCDTDVYLYKYKNSSYKKYLTKVAAGRQAWVKVPARCFLRAVNAGALNFNALKYNKWYAVSYNHSQKFYVTPKYCANPCKVKPGSISATQKNNCGGFQPKEFKGTAVTSNAGQAKYQWQIKRVRGTNWENIAGATAQNYTADYIESGSLWYRRAVKINGCNNSYYSNSVDLHVSGEGIDVNAGDDVVSCATEDTTLTAVVTGSTSCTTAATSDCNHTLYQSGGYQNRDYRHSNAAYCGQGKGAKLWTRRDTGLGFVTIDFGKVVPAGTKIHTRMRLAHCGNNNGNKSKAKIQSSLRGKTGFATIGNFEFTSQSYKEYTVTLGAATRFIKVIENSGCPLLVDYVRYETVGSSSNDITYEWSGPGIVGSTTTATITVNKSGVYTVKTKNCSECEDTDTVKVEINTPLTDAGTVSATQINCGGFEPEEFEGTEASGGNAGAIVYQWQIKRVRGTAWEDIDGATEQNYIADYIESGSLWYRRGAKREECGAYLYSNNIDLHVRQAPEVEVVVTNPDCANPTAGEIKFTFDDVTERSHIEFSLDGGLTYTTVRDDSQLFSFTELTAGDYDIWVRWGNDQCPVDLGTVTIEEVVSITADAGADQTICTGEEVVLSAQATGEGSCKDCTAYTIENTTHCKGRQDYVAYLLYRGIERRYSNVDLIWTELNDGTATLKGTIYDYMYANTDYEVDVVFSGRTTAQNEPYKEHDCNEESTSGWEYYTTTTGTLTQVGGAEVITIERTGEPFQVGNGANVTESRVGYFGASGWFSTNVNGIGDFNFNFGDCVTSTDTAFEYLWSTGETTQTISVAPNDTTTYTVEISNCSDCVAEDEVTVIVSDLAINAGDDQTIALGDSVLLQVDTTDVIETYDWSTGETTTSISVSPTETTTYTITATKGGCVATDTVTVYVVDPCTSQQYVVTATPIPVSVTGILNIDVAVDAAQDITYATYKMDGNITGPLVNYYVEKGCNTIAVDMGVHCNFIPQTNYILIVTGSGWSESIQFLTL